MGGFFHPLALLLRGDGYPAAMTFALLLHGGLALFLIERNFTSTFVEVQPMQFIQATTIAENPQAVATQQQKQVYEQQLARQRAEEQERQRQAQERARAEEAERQRQAEAAEQRRQAEAQERQRQADAERQRAAEADRQRQAEAEAAEQRRREEQAREEQARREQAARQEAARQEAERQAAQAAQAEAFASAQQSYMGIIQQTIQQYWSRPPSARNGMEVVLRIQLVPTGEVVDVDVRRSSGDFAFDRAAEQAVLKADRFPELQGMDSRLFEERFRTIDLVFRPEDLLR